MELIQRKTCQRLESYLWVDGALVSENEAEEMLARRKKVWEEIKQVSALCQIFPFLLESLRQ